MQMALANAGCTTEDIDYISAYGPGDPTLDAAEVRYIKEVFRERAYAVPVSSIKGVTGNPLAAAGPLQIARSEEHTSELQSLTNLVCRLLLEKKKNKKISQA